MLRSLRSVPRPKTGALLTSAAVLLSAGALGAAAPAPAADQAGAGEKARVTAAVLPLDGTAQKPVVYGDDVPYDTASIVKVDILATLLLQAQDAGRALTTHERSLAGPMIRHSDNAAANALWRKIGEAPGLAAANKRLGLTETRGGTGPRWGLTRTTASDQIRLLRAVFAPAQRQEPDAKPAALSEESRAYIRTLMAHVASGQAWGVSAAGPAAGVAAATAGSGHTLGAGPASASAFALKNGWLQRSTTGLWDVNSVGQVTAGGHRYLVAVLSDGNASMRDGVLLVQRTARAAVAAAAGR
jgi:beta-lactamase class A